MKSIDLHHYRCFEDLSLSFADKVTLLIGDNASGKTTVIRALGSVLNAFFSGFSDENTRFVGLSKEDFRLEGSDMGEVNDQPIRIGFSMLGVVASLELHSKKGRTLQKPLSPINSFGRSLHNGLFDGDKQCKPLPLLAAFSTSDIHATRKLNEERFKKYTHKPSFGYYECLQGDGFLPYWTKRLLVLKEAGKGRLEIEGVTAALIKGLGEEGCGLIRGMDIRHNQGKVYYTSLDGRETDTDHLSDGLRRLANIFLDLGFRCMLLNKGIYGLDACALTKGTVLIDEIDLHLHPTLQATAIQGLRLSFPNLQFIITSHAPMVMTGIPPDEGYKVILLAYDKVRGYIQREVQTYGLDASKIIELHLGVTPRSQQVDDQLSTLFGFIDREEYEHAHNALDTLKEAFGDNLPELAQAEAMLNFLDVGADD